MPLEDDFSDILKKARAGQGLSVRDVAHTTGLSYGNITTLERGGQPHDRGDVRLLAKALGLRSAPLERIVIDQWEPVAQRVPAWIETVHGSVSGYGVQGYILHDEGEALLIDTAYNAPAMIAWLDSHRVRLTGICLTHGHADHAEGIQQLLARWQVPVYLASDDLDLLHWRPSEDRLTAPIDGRSIPVGGIRVRCLTTPGHTPGGICYRVDASSQPVCFVGDTLFAGSIGRSNPHTLYSTHLDSVRQRVLKLPHDCILLPGHGPATTVREELDHNPFASDQ
ncbi:MAG TPA: MBL fold metallo-hydrolase [Nitrospiraceae bacterium]|jgi:glyoxylase-like metal-dependent hydrolase (beta-lactamase superfamily II)|nr:MBL fold metallo-hydrolase [Nitrospiraceae bacterium]